MHGDDSKLTQRQNNWLTFLLPGRCMEMVASQRADVTMLEAGDVYRAGKGYGLVPIMSEVRKIALYSSPFYPTIMSKVWKTCFLRNLLIFNAKVYNLGTDEMTGIPYYYSVAVVKIRDNSSELIYLKVLLFFHIHLKNSKSYYLSQRRNSCHTGLGQAAGWIIPMYVYIFLFHLRVRCSCCLIT